METLRRSGRSTKGVRRFEETVVVESPRKKEKKQESEKKQKEVKVVKAPAPQKEKFKKSLRGKNKSRGNAKNNTAPVKPQKDTGAKSGRDKRKRGNDDEINYDDETDEEEEEDENEEEDFHEYEADLERRQWSSGAETEYEFESGGEDYVPTGKNAQRQAAM